MTELLNVFGDPAPFWQFFFGDAGPVVRLIAYLLAAVFALACLNGWWSSLHDSAPNPYIIRAPKKRPRVD